MSFWQEKNLAEMSQAEWESLCDGCGQCCLNKLMDADTDEIYYTNVACNQLDIKTCRCKHYESRFDYEPDCIKLTQENLLTIEWLPETCAYRWVHEKRELPEWHPLITGSQKAMRKAGVFVGDYAVYEIDVIDWEDHILNKPE